MEAKKVRKNDKRLKYRKEPAKLFQQLQFSDKFMVSLYHGATKQVIFYTCNANSVEDAWMHAKETYSPSEYTIFATHLIPESYESLAKHAAVVGAPMEETKNEVDTAQ